MASQTNILSTKKLLPNQKQLLLDANFTVIEEDFIFVQSLRETKQSHINDNLIFSSQNAVNAVLERQDLAVLKSKNVFSVGMKTKELLTENGFNVIVYTDYASYLVEIISLIYSKESFTFFSGNLRRDVLPNTLKKNQITFNEIQVYETDLTSKKITTKLDGILFFSPSAVESYLKLNTIKNEMCFCIGGATAEALENEKIKNIIIADKPSVENVIAEVLEYYS